MKKNRKILYALSVLCLAGAAFSGWNLYKELKPRIEAEGTYEQVRGFAFEAESVQGQTDEGGKTEGNRGGPDFVALSAWNPDVVGWINGPDTVIDYPVVQGPDNDYYLNHTADGKKSVIGSIFVEKENRKGFQDDMTVIYGHHIKGGRMFSSLSGYKNQSYYDDHSFFYLYTPDADFKVELFAGDILDGQTASFPLIFGGENEREHWIDNVVARSTFRSDIRPEEGEKMVALCTCTYEFQDARYVVYGVLRPLEESE